MTDTKAVRRSVAALLAIDNRTPAVEWRSLDGLASPGLYAWFVDVPGAKALSTALQSPIPTGLIYGGQAGAGSSTATLGSRIGGNHLGGNTYGSTFRLTLAAALSEPLDLEPVGGRRMTRSSEARLTAWMLEHLSIAIDAFENRLELSGHESAVLAVLDPPLNLSKVAPTPLRAALSRRRRAYTMPQPSTAGRSADVRRVVDTIVMSPGGLGPTPEELARELGLPNAKRIWGYLREAHPRDPALLWARWGPLDPEREQAVRRRFGSRR